MSREFLTALLCGFAVTGQICAQEVVVAREAKANPTVKPVSKGTDLESETATEVRAKKSAPHVLTVEQMRMAGTLAAEREKEKTSAEQTISVPGTNLQTAKAGALATEQRRRETRPQQTNASRASTSHTTKSDIAVPVRPTMLETGKQESSAAQPAKAEVRGGQTTPPQSASSELHLSRRDRETKKDTMEVVTKERTAKRTRTVAHYSYKTPEGKKESIAVITHYYPKQIVYPVAKIDRHIDRKLMQAATIAQERAHAHSCSMCWPRVKEALHASGVIPSRLKSPLSNGLRNYFGST